MDGCFDIKSGREGGHREVCGQTLIEGDCIARMRDIPASSFDVIMTSPPYNLGIGYDRHNDKEPRERYLSWMSQVAEEMARVLCQDGSLFLNVGGSLKDPLIPYQVLEVFLKHFVLQNNIVWTKSLWIEKAEKTFGHFKPINSPRYLNHNFEHVFHLSHEGATRIERLAVGVPFEWTSNIERFGHEKNLRCRGNVWHLPYKSITSRKLARGGHPATFPVELPKMCIRLAGISGPAGRVRVLDPFLGTGTTLVAARDLGVSGTGIDLSKDYLDFAAERLTQDQGTKK